MVTKRATPADCARDETAMTRLQRRAWTSSILGTEVAVYRLWTSAARQTIVAAEACRVMA